MPFRAFVIGDTGLKGSVPVTNALGDIRDDVQSLPALDKYANEIIKVESGDRHTVVLLSSGELIVWGDSRNGLLGLEGALPDVVDVPMRLSLEGICDIAVGAAHTLALTSDGDVCCWGSNQFGQLGIGNLVDQKLPTKLHRSLPAMVSIAAGSHHSVFLSSSGHVYVTGRGIEGQIGLGEVSFQVSPHIIRSMSCYQAAAIVARGNMTAITTTDGSVWTTGEGSLGALAHDDIKTRRTPQRVVCSQQEVAVEKVVKQKEIPRYGTVESYKYSSKLHKPLSPIEPTAAFTKVAMGWGHSLFLDASGRVYSSGSNVKGQLGVGLKLAFTGMQEVKIAMPMSNSSADVAKRKFKIGAKVKWKGAEGVVVNHSRGRLGLEMADGERVGALPSDVYLRDPSQDDNGEGDERVFVDDIVCGTTFSAALSGSVLFLWGDIKSYGSHIPSVLPAEVISEDLLGVTAAYPTTGNSLILITQHAEESNQDPNTATTNSNDA